MTPGPIKNYKLDGDKLKFYFEAKSEEFGVCIKLNGIKVPKEPTPEQAEAISAQMVSKDQLKGTPLEGVGLTPITPEDFEKEGYDE